MWQLSYYTVLPLQEIILRKIIVHLWKVSIFDPGVKLRDVWDVFEGDVKEKILNLRLPRSIRNRMISLVKPIGADILNWQVFHENNFFSESEVFNIHSLQHLQRACTGLVDYGRTTEELVRHKIFNITKCFEMACLYCLEDIIDFLWEKLSEEDKNSFLLSVSTSTDVVRMYWAYFMSKDVDILNRLISLGSSPFYFNRGPFEYSAQRGNKYAAEYFFKRLGNQRSSSVLTVVFFSIHERFKLIDRSSLDFPAEKVSEVIRFLLSVMTPQQKMQVFENNQHELLLSLLYWHFESNFFDIAEFCWKFLPEEDYGKLLNRIRIFINKTGYYIPDMFQAFFINSPRAFRKHFVERECRIYKYLSIFSKFLRDEDIETIKVIFKNIDQTDKENLIFSVPVCKYLSHFILRDKWSFVEACIRAAKLSEEDKKMLECGLRYFARNLSRGIPAEWSRQKMNGFFNFLNETVDKNLPKLKKPFSGDNQFKKESQSDKDSHRSKKPCF